MAPLLSGCCLSSQVTCQICRWGRVLCSSRGWGEENYCLLVTRFTRLRISRLRISQPCEKAPCFVARAQNDEKGNTFGGTGGGGAQFSVPCHDVSQDPEHGSQRGSALLLFCEHRLNELGQFFAYVWVKFTY